MHTVTSCGTNTSGSCWDRPVSYMNGQKTSEHGRLLQRKNTSHAHTHSQAGAQTHTELTATWLLDDSFISFHNHAAFDFVCSQTLMSFSVLFILKLSAEQILCWKRKKNNLNFMRWSVSSTRWSVIYWLHSASCWCLVGFATPDCKNWEHDIHVCVTKSLRPWRNLIIFFFFCHQVSLLVAEERSGNEWQLNQ